MIKDPFIFRVLDISTGHMTRADARWLGSHDDLSAYELGEYGWLCYIGEIDDNWSGMSQEFRTVLMQAKELGCDYVRFDRDGREHDELPSFDW